MRKMGNYVALNWATLLVAAICFVVGITVLVMGFKVLTKLRTPAPEVQTTKSVSFADDPVVSTPVMADNPYANVFREAAQAAINGTNPWDYLRKNWQKAKDFNGVEPALLNFIVYEAHRQIPDSSSVTLSIRDYSDENSVVMQYRDPKTDSILVTTGHDPEPALYATFEGKYDTMTYKLVCANGLVSKVEGKGKVTFFEDDYIIVDGDSFIKITGATVHQAKKFAGENDLPVRFVVEGKVNSKTPNTSRVEVYGDYRHFRNGIFDVVLQPGDILRRKDGKWLYIRMPRTPSAN